MNRDKEILYASGIALAERFCAVNSIPMPKIVRLQPSDRLYHLATCAYYRPTKISIMVEKCANRGFGGRSWSWPGYTVDRTPYGVIQHELGHHVDNHFFRPDFMLSRYLHGLSGEQAMTGYLGTDSQSNTFFMEWFAEIFRVFVTNPDLCARLRPRFYKAITDHGICPVCDNGWREVLMSFDASERIIRQAEKKIGCVPKEALANASESSF